MCTQLPICPEVETRCGGNALRALGSDHEESSSALDIAETTGQSKAGHTLGSPARSLQRTFSAPPGTGEAVHPEGREVRSGRPPLRGRTVVRGTVAQPARQPTSPPSHRAAPEPTSDLGR